MKLRKKLSDGNWEIEAIRHRLLFVEIYLSGQARYLLGNIKEHDSQKNIQ